MAATNRDRIGKMFEILGDALDGVITEVLAPEIGDADWALVVKLADEEKGITGREYSRTDPAVQLRMLTERITGRVKKGWYPFDGVITHETEAYASLLREVRNKWAHNASFDDDAALRALDYAKLLLAAVGQTAASERINAILLDVRRIASGKQDARVLKASAVVPGAAGLTPWRQVLKPREEVATGNFQSSEFAADLYKVARDPSNTSSEYADPSQFFARTYLTEGLRDLITRAVKRLTGDPNASPVVNLQTNFGGGKSHSMLALWHLVGGLPREAFPQEAQELLAEHGYPADGITASRVALVGNHIAPQGEVKPDGTRVNTLWGELAWQLGGRDAFEIVREHDEKRTNPGHDLHVLLQRYAPAVILVDEWVAYARQLYGREDLAGGTFDTQFTFAQSLTEAAKSTPGVLLAISIPASHNADDSAEVPGAAEEVGGSNGMEALKRLQNVVRRVAEQWRPASSDEAYRIVKRRLFESEDAAALAQISATAKMFRDFYESNRTEFPNETFGPDYERRIVQTYPLHPELFDRLYEDWSSLERFQRTRGVLRLMNAVIHALWVGDDQGPLILPSSIPLSVASVNAELTQYLQDSWKAVIDADVDGPNSEPARIDNEKTALGQRSITKRLARTVFFGAAPTIGTAHKGVDTQRVFLGTAIPGDVVGNYHSALTQLADRTTYYYSSAGKHWYDTEANITRRAKDAADALHPEDVWAEVVLRLRAEERAGTSFAGVHVGPTDSGDIPDTDQARLVILHPKFAHRRGKTDSPAMAFAHQATERRGTANRTNRNMLVFLAADEERLAELDQATRSYLAWREIAAKSNELNLTPQQLAQATEKRDQFSNTVNARLPLCYQWVLNPVAPDPKSPFELEEVKADGQGQSMAERVAKKLGSAGAYSTEHAARSIRLALDMKVPNAWASGSISLENLWSLYAQYPYMPRLRSREVLYAALENQPLLWQSEGVAIAEGFDGATDRFVNLWLPTDPGRPLMIDSALVVQPSVAEPQRLADVAVGGESDTVETALTGGHDGAATQSTGEAHTRLDAPAAPKRYIGTAPISAERYSGDFAKIATEVLANLAESGAELRISLSIDAVHPTGFTEQQLRTIRENASTLKFSTNEFEAD